MATDRQMANTRHKRITAAAAAMAHVEPWMAFRWLVAQQYNAHHAVGRTQVLSKERSMQLATSLVAELGGDILALTPKAAADAEEWLAFTAAATAMGPYLQHTLLRTIWRNRWGDDLSPAPELGASQDQLQRLIVTLADMYIQQTSNDRKPQKRRGPKKDSAAKTR